MGTSSPLFGDEVWDFSSVMPTARSYGVVSFAGVPESYRHTVKEIGYALLNLSPRRGGHPLKPGMVTVYLRELGLLTSWLTDRGTTRFADVTQSDLDTYLAVRQARTTSKSVLGRVVRTIQAAYTYRAFLTTDSLTFAPWEGRRATKVVGSRPTSRNNTTPRIPEEVSGPLLSWALFYVETVSEELLTEWRQRDERRTQAVEATVDPLTGQPWRVISPSLKTRRQVSRVECDMLGAACLTVIAFLTGMRFKECLSIRPGCITPLRAVPGGVDVYELQGQTFKSERALEGRAVSWYTVEPVRRAVEILTELAEGSEHIFSTRLSWDRAYFKPVGLKNSVRSFQEHIRDHHASAARPGPPLGEDGSVPHVTAQQFRRTLAAYIALQPYGVVAGMIQYKHVQVATFEGYAGTDESGFAAEVRLQEELCRYDDVIKIYEDLTRGAVSAGNHSRILEREVTAAADGEVAFEGQVLSEEVLERLARVKLTKTPLHRGALTDCFYDPDQAMCKKQVDQAEGPVLSRCQPLHCSCSHITTEKIPGWEARVAEWETRGAAATSELQAQQAAHWAAEGRGVLLTLQRRDGTEVDV